MRLTASITVLACFGLNLLGLLGLVGCEDENVVVIKIVGRPAVNTIEDLKVRVVADGIGQERVFSLAGQSLPQTFSVSSTSLTGDLSITVDAVAGGLIVASGALTTRFADSDPTLMLEPLDFVVNSKYPGGQQINRDRDMSGFQIANFPDGTFDVAFIDNINEALSTHSLAGRRFSVDGLPVATSASSGTAGSFDYLSGFIGLNTAVSIANNGVKTVAVWDDSDLGKVGIKCRSMNRDGAFAGAPVTVAPDAEPDVVSAVALPNGNFLLVWVGREPNTPAPNIITGQVIKGDCSSVGIPFQVNTVVTTDTIRPSIAVRANGFMISWISGTEVRYRTYSSALIADTAAEKILIPTPVNGANFHARVVAMADGYAVLLAQEIAGQTNQRLLLQRLSNMGLLLGAPILISNNADKYYGPTVIGRGGQEPIAVAWDECGENSLKCEIAMQLFRPNGHPVGEPLVVNSTVNGEQFSPSISQLSVSGVEPTYAVAWTDLSLAAPDNLVSAVRARIVYPPFNAAVGIQGADCRGTGVCDPGLVCLAGTDGGARCSKECSATSTCPGGGSCMTQGQVKGCLF